MWAALIYLVVTTILTIALAPRPPTPAAAQIGDFTLPTVQQGRPVPIIFGTCNITGANCVWYGDLVVNPVRQHSLFSSATIGYQYLMGFHLALGHGPFDSINKCYWDQKLTWAGNSNGSGGLEPITADGNMAMSWLNLYGGEKSEGGVQGIFNVIFGTPGAEAQNPYLVSQLGNVPAFRGVTSVVWVNGTYTDNFTTGTYAVVNMTAGCGYIGTTPYVKGIEFECTRIVNGWNIAGGCWNPSKAVVQLGGGTLTAPPTWSPTFIDQITSAITSTTQTTVDYNDGGNGGQQSKNYNVLISGYMQIGSEWIYVPSVQAVVVGGVLQQTGVFNLVRGEFGTTASTYANGTPFYFFVTTTEPVDCMNPAHIVYQILTDPIWGMGLSTALLDNTAFTAAALTFYNEGTGLCMQWVNASTCEDFLKIVLNHCAANLVLNNATGLYQLLPIRGGYSTTGLPSFDEDDILEMTSWATPGWADQVNEIVLVYTDPATRANTAITGQDIANIDVQGKIVSQQVNYQGIRDNGLAATTLGRELSARCTPLITVKFKINRDAFVVSIGGLFKLSWADRDTVDMVCRITNINQGTIGDNTILVEAVQDIYALGLYNYQVVTSAPSSRTVTTTYPPDSNVSTGGPTVISATVTTPPITPKDGDSYIVPSGATGAWANEEGNVAQWDASSGSWVFIPIPHGVLVYDQATGAYLTTNGAGAVLNSEISGDVLAIDVTYDDATTNLGVTNVQDAIELLASNMGSTINMQAYDGNGTWYGTTFDGTTYTCSDGQNWVNAASLGEQAFQNMIYVSSLNKFFGTFGNQIGVSGSGHTSAVVLGAWTYNTPSPAPSTGAWEGIAWLPSISKLVIWSGTTILTSSNGTSWANPITEVSYRAAVLADSPKIFYEFGGNGGQVSADSGSDNFPWAGAPETGGVTGNGWGSTSPLLNSGDAVYFVGTYSYIEPRSGSPAPGAACKPITGSGPFTIELWIEKYQTVPGAGMNLYGQYDIFAGVPKVDQPTLALSIDSSNKLHLTTATHVYASGLDTFTTGLSLSTSAAYNLFDGNPHHVVAGRDGSGAASIWVDNVEVASATGTTVDNLANTYIAGSVFGVDPFGNAASGQATWQNCALYSTYLSSTRIGVHYNAAFNGLPSNAEIFTIIDDTAVGGNILVFVSYENGSAGGSVAASLVPELYSDGGTGLAQCNFLSDISLHPTTDNITITGVADGGGGLFGVVGRTVGTNDAWLAKTTNSGTSWTYPAPSWPTSPQWGIDTICWDGTTFIMTGEGWSAVSAALTSFTFSTGASEIPASFGFSALYPNGSGTTGATPVLEGGGVQGAAFTGTLPSTTNGLVWLFGPKIKATAAQVSYNGATNDTSATNVQAALDELAGGWNIIKQRILGD